MDFITKMDTSEFKMSDEHIINAEKNHSQKCAVALCLQEYADSLVYNQVKVFNNTAKFYIKYRETDSYHHVFLSEGLKKWIDAFDSGDECEPVSIFIDNSKGSPPYFHLQDEPKPYY